MSFPNWRWIKIWINNYISKFEFWNITLLIHENFTRIKMNISKFEFRNIMVDRCNHIRDIVNNIESKWWKRFFVLIKKTKNVPRFVISVTINVALIIIFMTLNYKVRKKGLGSLTTSSSCCSSDCSSCGSSDCSSCGSSDCSSCGSSCRSSSRSCSCCCFQCRISFSSACSFFCCSTSFSSWCCHCFLFVFYYVLCSASQKF